MNIQRTVFKDFRTTNETYGFRAWDDQSSTYCNGMSREELCLPDSDFLKLVKNSYADDMFYEMFDSAVECDDLITIDYIDYQYRILAEGNDWTLVFLN